MLKTIKGLYISSRMFPYLGQLIIVFPFYAILLTNGFIDSSYSLFLILPFIGIKVIDIVITVLGLGG